jgi:hypothetical protein
VAPPPPTHTHTHTRTHAHTHGHRQHFQPRRGPPLSPCRAIRVWPGPIFVETISSPVCVGVSACQRASVRARARARVRVSARIRRFACPWSGPGTRLQASSNHMYVAIPPRTTPRLSARGKCPQHVDGGDGSTQVSVARILPDRMARLSPLHLQLGRLADTTWPDSRWPIQSPLSIACIYTGSVWRRDIPAPHSAHSRVSSPRRITTPRHGPRQPRPQS